MRCMAQRQCCSTRRIAVVRLAIGEPSGTAMLALSVIETREFSHLRRTPAPSALPLALSSERHLGRPRSFLSILEQDME